jgi:hypothetical protein
MSKRAKPFWRRQRPPGEYDIALLRSPSLTKRERFETVIDATAESERSENLLSNDRRSASAQITLKECRDGHYSCEKTFCPLCARVFRRWFIGQTLRVVAGSETNQIMTVLLNGSQNIHDLDPSRYTNLIRKRLDQAGLGDVPVIGGFEIVYRARDKDWVLHINLLFVGTAKLALSEFEMKFTSNQLMRPTHTVSLNNVAEQLSYLLKFTTYHRPFHQVGHNRSPAKPLNTRQHAALINWMSRFAFKDMLFLHRVKRKGDRLYINGK